MGGGVFFSPAGRLGRAWQPACAVPRTTSGCVAPLSMLRVAVAVRTGLRMAETLAVLAGAVWVKAQASRWWGHPPAPISYKPGAHLCSHRFLGFLARQGVLGPSFRV